MEVNLKVDRSTCIKCGKCVKVCPSKIFYQEAPASEVLLRNVQTCIFCGHCVAVCPTFSVIHSEFPQSRVHKIDYKSMPSPEQVALLIKSRRSNRAFSKQPIPDEYFDSILEAAHRAPTASNMQQVSFTLVTDPVELKKVIDVTMSSFISMERKMSNPLLKPFIAAAVPGTKKLLPLIGKLTEAYKAGQDVILRNATALILIHTPASSRFGCQDANLAYQNASLMAEALGVAHFYTGFVCTAAGRDKKLTLEKALGIEGRIHAGMAMAMPSLRFPNYIDRQEIRVNYKL